MKPGDWAIIYGGEERAPEYVALGRFGERFQLKGGDEFYFLFSPHTEGDGSIAVTREQIRTVVHRPAELEPFLESDDERTSQVARAALEELFGD